MKYEYYVCVSATTDCDSPIGTVWVTVRLDTKVEWGTHSDGQRELETAALNIVGNAIPAIRDHIFVDEAHLNREINTAADFLGADYAEKIAKVKAAYAGLRSVLDETDMALCVDTRGDYMLTAIPRGIIPNDVVVGELLDSTIALDDEQLVSILP